MSYYAGYGPMYSVSPPVNPISPATHSQQQTPYATLQAQVQQLRHRCEQLAFITGQTSTRSAEFANRMTERFRHRVRCLLKANRNGNTRYVNLSAASSQWVLTVYCYRSCPWHAGRKEKLQYEARRAPPGYLNCGCKETEALLQETLLRYALRSEANRDERLRPELIRGLLELLEERYDYVDGDFHLVRTTGEWRRGEEPFIWAQAAEAS